MYYLLFKNFPNSKILLQKFEEDLLCGRIVDASSISFASDSLLEDLSLDLLLREYLSLVTELLT